MRHVTLVTVHVGYSSATVSYLIDIYHIYYHTDIFSRYVDIDVFAIYQTIGNN
jgi:hypothetical protein